MSQTTTRRWERKRTADSRQVERILRTKFPCADAYRYNAASIRVRVIDERFEGKSAAERDAMVEVLLKQLPRKIQGDIMNLLTATPEEIQESPRHQLANLEFEEPSPSVL